jgi:hypothetical protein
VRRWPAGGLLRELGVLAVVSALLAAALSAAAAPTGPAAPPASAPGPAVPGTARAPYLSRGDEVEARYEAYRARLGRFFEALR